MLNVFSVLIFSFSNLVMLGPSIQLFDKVFFLLLYHEGDIFSYYRHCVFIAYICTVNWYSLENQEYMFLMLLSCWCFDNRSDWDRSRSERLAQLHIEERLGKRQEFTTQEQPNIEELEKHEIVDLQVLVAKEITKKHFYEREVFTEWKWHFVVGICLQHTKNISFGIKLTYSLPII